MLLRLALVAIVAIAALALATGAARSEGADALRLVLFSGTELGEGRAGTSGGFKLALRGDVDRPGPIVMGLANAQADVAEIGVDAAVGSVGATRVDVETPRGFASGALIGGWQWFTPGGSVLTLAAGPEAATRQEPGPDGLLVWGDVEIGARVLAEVWAHPRPGFLATGTLVASSATESLWARGAVGWRLPGPWPLTGAYVGPEVTFYADAGYREPRIGLHVTELKLGGITLRLGGGWSLGDGEGGYLALTTHTKM